MDWNISHKAEQNISVDTGVKKKSDCQLFIEQDNVKKKLPFPTYLVDEHLGSHYLSGSVPVFWNRK